MSESLELQKLVDSETGSHHIQRSTKAYKLIQNCYSCPFLGILLATLSSLFFSLCSVIVKQLVDINPIELATFRYDPIVHCIHNEKSGFFPIFFFLATVVIMCNN